MPSSPKGSSNSNKTAHVMNLLRKNTPTPPPAPAEQEAPAPAAAPVPQPAPAAPAAPAPQPAPAKPQSAPIITALNADSEISSQIRDALADELAQEVENEASALSVAQEPVKENPEPKLTAEPLEAKPQPQPEPVPEPVPEPIPEPIPEPVPEPVPVPVPEPVPEPIPEPAPVSAEVPDNSFYSGSTTQPKLVNVMHQLVDEKADKYIELSHACSCPQCRNDVIALTLNRLPSKYVVVSDAELRLKSDMFRVRYNCEIISQLMNSCDQVKAHPHHKS